MIRQVKLADGTPLKLPGIVPKLSGHARATSDWVGPALGEHTDAVLARRGYGSDRHRAAAREPARSEDDEVAHEAHFHSRRRRPRRLADRAATGCPPNARSS